MLSTCVLQSQFLIYKRYTKMDEKITEIADAVADNLNADVVLYNAPLRHPVDNALVRECTKRHRRKNVLLILVTRGGGPDPAYRIARCFQTQYKRFIIYVPGLCKSAGTLVAIGAHELIMSDHGELGPLDVQMPKQDDLWGMQSGLTVMGILENLQREAIRTFQKAFMDLMSSGAGSITLKTAAEIATKMTSGLFAPLYSQVDPLHLGEAGRSMDIAGRYGAYLLREGGNINMDSLMRIMTEYPSHSFVIDRKEADDLFKEVRLPDEKEMKLVEALGDEALVPIWTPPNPFRFLSSELPMKEDEQTNQENQ